MEYSLEAYRRARQAPRRAVGGFIQSNVRACAPRSGGEPGVLTARASAAV